MTAAPPAFPTSAAVSTPRSALWLRCPRCAIDMAGADCPRCSFRLDTSGGIVRALPPERVARYARFIADYELIRTAEGRGGDSERFYFELPYKDITGKNTAQWRIRARSYDYLFHQLLQPKLPPSATILDLGAGNCWMSFRLRHAGYKPVAVDLLTNRYDGLAAAEKFRQRLPELFPRFQAELSRLPFQSAQFDCVIFNASFHYAEDAGGVLCEALRCTRAGGFVIISDSPWYSGDESGQQMIGERRAAFLHRYGTASDSIGSLEYLTNERLHSLAEQGSVTWAIHTPRYGFRWALRPLIAKLRGRREPSRFRIYVARKAS